MSGTNQEQTFKHNSAVVDEKVEAARKMIGQPLRIRQWNKEASIDGITHYAVGLGDDNPLWLDETYGRTTRWGATVAPPTYLYAIWAAGIGYGFPGLQAFHAGGRWEFMRYVKAGERVLAEAKMTDLKVICGKRAGRMLLQVGEALYRTPQGELLSRHEARAFRVPRPGADPKGGLKYESQSKTWTDAELDDMDAEILAYQRRGADTRFWEDVRVGESLPRRIKGPLNLSTMIAYYAGNCPGYVSTDLQVKNRHLARHHPERLPNNRPPELQAERVSFGQGHHDPKVASAVGMPGVYDNGWMRIGWAQQMLTDWMGDDGFLKVIDCSIKLPNVVGDVLRMTGKVTGKRMEGGESLVDVELRAERHDGELSMTGFGTMALKARST